MGQMGQQQHPDIPPSVGSGRTPVAQQQGTNPYGQPPQNPQHNAMQRQMHNLQNKSPLNKDSMFRVQSLISSLDEIMKMSIDQQMQNQYARLDKMDANLNALQSQNSYSCLSPKVVKQKTSWDPLKTD